MVGFHADPGGVVMCPSSCRFDVSCIVRQGSGVHVDCQIIVCQEICAKDRHLDFRYDEWPGVFVTHVNV